MYKCLLHVYLCDTCRRAASGIQGKELDPLDQELQRAVCSHIDAWY